MIATLIGLAMAVGVVWINYTTRGLQVDEAELQIAMWW